MLTPFVNGRKHTRWTHICTRRQAGAWGGWGRPWPRAFPTSASGCQRGRAGWAAAGPAATGRRGWCTGSRRAPCCPGSSAWRTSDSGGSARCLEESRKERWRGRLALQQWRVGEEKGGTSGENNLLAPIGNLELLPAGSTSSRKIQYVHFEYDKQRVHPISPPPRSKTLSMGSLPDGYLTQIHRIWETKQKSFHALKGKHIKSEVFGV